MGLFNRAEVRRAQADAAEIFRAITGRAWTSTDISASKEACRFAAAVATTEVLPSWTLAPNKDALCRNFVRVLPLDAYDDAVGLAAGVAGLEVLFRFPDLSDRDRLKVSRHLGEQAHSWLSRLQYEEIGSRGPSAPTQSTGALAQPTLLTQACRRIGEAAASLTAAAQISVRINEFVDGSTKPRTLSAVQNFTRTNPGWRLHSGVLKWQGRAIAEVSNEDDLSDVFVTMMAALVESDYSDLSNEDRETALATAPAYWLLANPDS
ncbi:MAG: hypothetical protein R2724_34330 [Bryobacterales bacterium]